ncbi:multiple organellar RNA editing factor 8, chloroplastic/mitochondrial-like [Papaver somniferum]|uniref:multiple organellar RNA editing factor 8, chloroplastic/mitochondrial-like n=1 Tax=Papaver somniferum TaxID=3469 RepID=UPI000E6F47EE|nr:multiple organellar RNA editing factor 8, chloroplastic/mitochondrial-like [Papaver somniferum]
MALCRRGGALIIKSFPSSSSPRSLITSSSSYYSSHLSRPVAALTEFTNRFPILSAASLSTHAAATTTRSLSSVNHRQSDRKYSRHKDTDWLPGCDLKHWLVVMEKPEGEPSRDELIDTYIKTLSKYALPGVRWVLPDSYMDEENKDYGGEPFINGKAVPYDPKYHEEWIRNNNNKQRARERDRQRNSSPGGDVQPNTGGPPEDFNSNGKYQLGRATIVDN